MLRKILCWMVLVAAVTLAGCSATTNEAPQTGSGPGYVGGKSFTQVDPDKRKQAPVVTGPRLGGGDQLSTVDRAGRVVVVNVWGSWCSPCRQEAPDLVAAAAETKSVASFIGINARDNDPAPAEAFVRAFGVDYPSIYDPSGKTLVQYAGELPPTAIPSTLIIDRQGRIAVRILGPISKITLVDLITEVADE